MKCPHCSIAFHDNWLIGSFYRHHEHLRESYNESSFGFWKYRSCICPQCKNVTIEIGIQRDENLQLIDWHQVCPSGSNRGPVPGEVPEHIANDYIEACNVLSISAKASAALSRRCLQSIFHENGYKSGNLAREIDLFLNESDPSRIAPLMARTAVDLIRNFGNFSAHPITEVTSLQIIDVEPHEAETCLEIIETLFEHFFVAPAKIARTKEALDKKLRAAGKSSVKNASLATME